MSTKLEAAIKYAAYGFSVFPIHWTNDGRCSCGDQDCGRNTGKHPLTQNGFKDATTEEAQIRSWWSRWPEANIGIATGPASGIYVVDVDVHSADGFATLASLEDELGPLPETLCARTGSGGEHLVFRYPANGVRFGNTEAKLGAGIDTRGDGGYIVAAPSVHRSGGIYEWKNRLPIAELPKTYIEKLSQNGVHKEPAPLPDIPRARAGTTPYGRAALKNACDRVARAQEGSRNSTLNIAALQIGHLVAGREIDAEEAKAALASAAHACGLGAREIRSTLRSGFEAGLREPKSAPPLYVHTEGDPLPEPVVAETPWDDPIPLDEFPVPEFPFETLPYPVREWVRDTAVALQVPPDLPAMLSLAVMAAACAGKFEVTIRGSWTEPLNLYSIVAMEPGNRKSAAFSSATRTIYAYQAERQEEEKIARRKEADLHKAVEQKVSDARKALSAAKTPEQKTKAEEEYEAALQELKDTPKPKAPFKLVGDDVTPERVVGILSEQQGRFALFSAEGGLLKTVVGTRYSKNATPSYDALLKAHAGDPITHDRQGTESVHVQRPALTLGLCVQPEIITTLASEPSAKGVGLLARFLYSVPKNMVGSRQIRPRSVSPDVEMSYQSIVRRLLEQPDVKTTVGFTAEADDRLAEFEATLEPRLSDEGELSPIVEWASKLAGTVARIAALLHITESVCPGGSTVGSVSLTNVERALQIGEYLLSHASAALRTAVQPKEAIVAARVLRWVARTGERTFSLRDCFIALKSGRGSVTRVDDLAPAIRLLASNGYVRTLQGSRSDSLQIVVHPTAKLTASEGSEGTSL